MLSTPVTEPQTETQRAQRLGRYLQERRTQLGLTRPEFVAEMARLGEAITSDHLAKIENGQRQLQRVAVNTREVIRTLLGIDPETWHRDTGLYVPKGSTDAAGKA